MNGATRSYGAQRGTCTQSHQSSPGLRNGSPSSRDLQPTKSPPRLRPDISHRAPNQIAQATCSVASGTSAGCLPLSPQLHTDQPFQGHEFSPFATDIAHRRRRKCLPLPPRIPAGRIWGIFPGRRPFPASNTHASSGPGSPSTARHATSRPGHWDPPGTPLKPAFSCPGAVQKMPQISDKSPEKRSRVQFGRPLGSFREIAPLRGGAKRESGQPPCRPDEIPCAP